MRVLLFIALCLVQAVFSVPAVTNYVFHYEDFEVDDSAMKGFRIELTFDQDIVYDTVNPSTLEITKDGFEELWIATNNTNFATISCNGADIFTDFVPNQGPPLNVFLLPPTEDPLSDLLIGMDGVFFDNVTISDNKLVLMAILEFSEDKKREFSWPPFSADSALECAKNGTLTLTWNPSFPYIKAASDLSLPTGVITFDQAHVYDAPAMCSEAGLNIAMKRIDDAMKRLRFMRSENSMRVLGGAFNGLFQQQSFRDCMELTKSLAILEDKEYEVFDDRCHAEEGTSIFNNDPCCNLELARSMCCAEREASVIEEAITGKSAVVDTCESPTKVGIIIDHFKEFTEKNNKQESGCDFDFDDLGFDRAGQCLRGLGEYNWCRSDDDCPISCDQSIHRCTGTPQALAGAVFDCFIEETEPAIVFNMLRALNAHEGLSSMKDKFVGAVIGNDCQFGEEVLCHIPSANQDSCQHYGWSARWVYYQGGMTCIVPTRKDHCEHFEKEGATMLNPKAHLDDVMQADGKVVLTVVEANSAVCTSMQSCNYDHSLDMGSCETTGSFCRTDEEGRRVDERVECVGMMQYDDASCSAAGGVMRRKWDNDDSCLFPETTVETCFARNLKCQLPSEPLEEGDYAHCWQSSCYTEANATVCDTLPNREYHQVINGKDVCFISLDHEECPLAGYTFQDGVYFTAGNFISKETCENNVCTVGGQGPCNERSHCEGPSCHYCRPGFNDQSDSYGVCVLPVRGGDMKCLKGFICKPLTNQGTTETCNGDSKKWDYTDNICYKETTETDCDLLGGIMYMCTYDLAGECKSDTRAHLLNCKEIERSCENEEDCHASHSCSDDYMFHDGGLCFFDAVMKEDAHELRDTREPTHDEIFHNGDSSSLDHWEYGYVVKHDYRANMTMSMCTNNGGKWLTRATNEEECLSHIFCREDGDTLTKMSLDECDACGYDDYREAEWQSGYWRNGESVAATWTPKEFAPTYTFEESVRVNLIQQAFMSAMFQKIGSLYEVTLRCHFGIQMAYMPRLACDCAENKEGCFGTVVKKRVATQAVKAHVAAKIELPSASVDIPAAVFPEDAGEVEITFDEVTALDVIGALRRRGAGVYAIIKDGEGTLVGQLYGDGLEIESSVAPTADFQVCLKPDTSIPTDAAYVIKDFSKGDANDKPGAPLGLTITIDGDKWCADVDSMGLYFPILRLDEFVPEETTDEDESSAAVFGACLVALLALLF